MSIEQRLRRLEDRAAINDLVVGYFLAADGDDLNGVGASFTDDATFSSSGVINASGRQGIVDFISGARDHMGLTIHTPHYAQLAFDGDDAADGIVGAHLELALGENSVCAAVRYVDRYARVNDRWLISTRDMRTIYVAPWADVGEAFASASPVRWPGAAATVSDFPRKKI
jgi:hypothetical protein